MKRYGAILTASSFLLLLLALAFSVDGQDWPLRASIVDNQFVQKPADERAFGLFAYLLLSSYLTSTVTSTVQATVTSSVRATTTTTVQSTVTTSVQATSTTTSTTYVSTVTSTTTTTCTSSTASICGKRRRRHAFFAEEPEPMLIDPSVTDRSVNVFQLARVLN